MAVIGFDFGSASCILTTDQNDRIEIIDNDYFERKTPSIMAFIDKNRIFGTPAKNQQASNVNNTIHDFKKLFKTNPGIYFDVESKVSKHTRFNLNQITAMLFSKMKENANAFLTPFEVKGCILAAPAYFTTEERKALLVASGIADLNCVNIIKETTAVAINYGYFKKFSKPFNVFFVDIGQSACQVCACTFSTNQLQIIAETSTLIGGRDIDELLYEHFVKGFRQQELSENFKSILMQETEKLKTNMSLDTDEMNLNIRSLLTEGSVLPSMKRSKMEEICANLFTKIEETIFQCLAESGLQLDEVDSVEVVGGSTRIPKVKQLIENVFGKMPRSTNQDESVSRGCLLWSKLKNERPEFKIIEKPTIEQRIDHPNGIIVHQVHPNFIGRGDEILPVTESELTLYKDIENDLADLDSQEKKRLEARNKLEELIIVVEAPNGFLQQLDDDHRPILADGLTKMKRWEDGTILEYEEKYRQLEALVNRRPDESTFIQDDESDNDQEANQNKKTLVKAVNQEELEDDNVEEENIIELRNSSKPPPSESSYEQSTISRRRFNPDQDFVRSFKTVKETRHFPDYELYQQMHQPRKKYLHKPRDFILQRERERENPFNVCSPS